VEQRRPLRRQPNDHNILPRDFPRSDLGKVRRSEKESVAARDRRIMEFPLSMSPNAVAKALRAEGWYSKGTTVYHVGYRVRRLRAKLEHETYCAHATEIERRQAIELRAGPCQSQKSPC
jgi:hypothetical protein